jgi:LDH2 family malate/lactate/ureidoglycolate dehydrogenase
MRYLPVDVLHNFMQEVFIKLGVPQTDAQICSDVLIASDLKGIESHGVGRLKMYYDRIQAKIQNPITNIEVIRDKFATAVWDGNNGMGQVISQKAMQTAIDKAEKYGLGAVAVRNSTHFGICGYYAEMAIKQNMIGLVFSNARPSICPTNSVSPIWERILSVLELLLIFLSFFIRCCHFHFQRGKVEQLAREEKETHLVGQLIWKVNLTLYKRSAD